MGLGFGCGGVELVNIRMPVRLSSRNTPSHLGFGVRDLVIGFRVQIWGNGF